MCGRCARAIASAHVSDKVCGSCAGAFKKAGTKAIRVKKQLPAGTSRTRFTARLTRKKHLRPGTWTITVIARTTDETSNTRKARLKVVR